MDTAKWTNCIEIPKNAFEGVTFTKMIIQSCKKCNEFELYIDPEAFGKSSLFVQQLDLSIKSTSNFNDLRDAFVAINSLANLRILHINAGFKITHSHLFRNVISPGHRQNKLKIVEISGGFIQTIQSYPFYELTNLNMIDLKGNKISKIERHSFAFRDFSQQEVSFDLIFISIEQ